MILVTGANGFLGSYVCEELLRRGMNVRALCRENADLSRLDGIRDRIELATGDILDLPQLGIHFQGIESVVHCAARISFDGNDCNELMVSNMEGTRNVVNCALRYEISYLLHVSSTAAVGRVTSHDVLDEESKWNISKYTSCYGRSKHLAELEVWRGISEGLCAGIINPSVILGRNTYEKGSGMLFKYVREEHRFYPSGNLNFVDVRDVARITAEMVERKISGRRFILNANTVSYGDFFTHAAQKLGIKPPTVSVSGKQSGIVLLLDRLRHLFKGGQRLLSRETVRSSASKHSFKNLRIREELNYSFIPLNETLDWILQGEDSI